MRLAEAFPEGRFEPPATQAAISATEAQLGVKFPDELRALYLETDGFREHLGNAQYLSPLSEVVSSTQFMWETLPASIPEIAFPDLKPFVFFGSDGVGGWWGMRTAPPHEIIYWHHHLLDEGPIYQTQDGDVIAVMKAALALYDETEQ